MNFEKVTVEYPTGPRDYLARGYLNRMSAPIGTILGPNTMGEFLTVVENDILMDRVRVAHSRPEDFRDMVADSRSVCEHRMIVDARQKMGVR